MTEKLTDNSFLNLFKSVANINYNVHKRPDLFQSLVPDGWFENNSNELLIIENKSSFDDFDKARSQLLKYKNTVRRLNNIYTKIYLLFGYHSGQLFDYKIYSSNMRLTKLRLEDLNLEPKNKLPGLNSYESETTHNIVRVIKRSQHKEAIMMYINRMMSDNNKDNAEHEVIIIDNSDDEESDDDESTDDESTDNTYDDDYIDEISADDESDDVESASEISDDDESASEISDDISEEDVFENLPKIKRPRRNVAFHPRRKLKLL
jgi:hypothetical protein